MIELFLCTSCTYTQFPSGRRGDEEREEMLKHFCSSGYKTHVAACLAHVSCTERNWVWFGKKNLGETKPLYTYQPINPGKEFFTVPGTHVNKCSCTVKPYPNQEGKSFENQNMQFYLYSIVSALFLEFITRQKFVSFTHQGTAVTLLLGKGRAIATSILPTFRLLCV